MASPKKLQTTLDGHSWDAPSRPRTSGLRVTKSTNPHPVNARRRSHRARQANTRQPDARLRKRKRKRKRKQKRSTPPQGVKAVPYGRDEDGESSNEGEEHSTEGEQHSVGDGEYIDEVEKHSDKDGDYSEEDGQLPDHPHTSRNKENMGPMKDNGTLLQCHTLVNLY